MCVCVWFYFLWNLSHLDSCNHHRIQNTELFPHKRNSLVATTLIITLPPTLTPNNHTFPSLCPWQSLLCSSSLSFVTLRMLCQWDPGRSPEPGPFHSAQWMNAQRLGRAVARISSLFFGCVVVVQLSSFPSLPCAASLSPKEKKLPLNILIQLSFGLAGDKSYNI